MWHQRNYETTFWYYTKIAIYQIPKYTNIPFFYLQDYIFTSTTLFLRPRLHLKMTSFSLLLRARVSLLFMTTYSTYSMPPIKANECFCNVRTFLLPPGLHFYVHDFVFTSIIFLTPTRMRESSSHDNVQYIQYATNQSQRMFLQCATSS
jgi:hypothetical protein